MSSEKMSSHYPVWVPYVFGKTIFLWSLVFYLVVGGGARLVARSIWRGDDKETHRKRDTVGRWTPSLVHALGATITGALAMANVQWSLDYEGVIMHSLGYFLADLIVDHDPGYVVHHLGPIFHAEVLLRLGAGFYHTMRAGWFCEFGNVVAHSAAIFTFRKGHTFHTINAWSFWISRPLSYYDGFMAWYSDLPSEARWTWLGLIPLISILGIYHANTKWMIQMYKNQRKHKHIRDQQSRQDHHSKHHKHHITNGINGADGDTNTHHSNGAEAGTGGERLIDRSAKKLGPSLPSDVPLEPHHHNDHSPTSDTAATIGRVSSRNSNTATIKKDA